MPECGCDRTDVNTWTQFWSSRNGIYGQGISGMPQALTVSPEMPT